MGFGERLTAKRKAKGLTQDQLGRGLGTDGKDASKAVVYGWEKDQHAPRVDQLVLICERLDCSADFLLFGREQNSLSPEVLAFATEVETFDAKTRARVLRLCRDLLVVVREHSSASGVGPVAEPDGDAPIQRAV